MVNVLQAMILTDKEKMVLTPTYHVFEMYIPFQDSTFLPAQVEGPQYKHGEFALGAVDVSAARDAQGRLHIALVNADPHRGASVTANITGARARSATGRVLTAAAMDARNTFDKPNAIQPAPFKATRKGEALQFELPPKSVVVVAVGE